MGNPPDPQTAEIGEDRYNPGPLHNFLSYPGGMFHPKPDPVLLCFHGIFLKQSYLSKGKAAPALLAEAAFLLLISMSTSKPNSLLRNPPSRSHPPLHIPEASDSSRPSSHLQAQPDKDVPVPADNQSKTHPLKWKTQVWSSMSWHKYSCPWNNRPRGNKESPAFSYEPGSHRSIRSAFLPHPPNGYPYPCLRPAAPQNSPENADAFQDPHSPPHYGHV